MSYDIWKTNAPDPFSEYPLRCPACGEHVWDSDYSVGDVHCRDENGWTEFDAVLEWDYGYDWRDDDPRIP